MMLLDQDRLIIIRVVTNNHFDYWSENGKLSNRPMRRLQTSNQIQFTEKRNLTEDWLVTDRVIIGINIEIKQHINESLLSETI